MPYTEADQIDLTSLAESAGVVASPTFFRIVTELLTLRVSPEDIYNLLRQIASTPEDKDQPGSSGQRVQQ